MKLLTEIKDAIGHLIYPHVCEGCGSDVLQKDHELCAFCIASMPKTAFQFHAGNPMEKLFWGRLPIASATAQYYFHKESMMQRLMHAMKYRGNKELGLYLGKLMGAALLETHRFADVDALVPLPLFRTKERRRGYNQAALLCNGMAQMTGKPVLEGAVVRTAHTESQTSKSRVERWINMEGRFQLMDADAIKGLHLLLVDDVVTTGATLEACGQELLSAGGVRLSLATLCFSTH